MTAPGASAAAAADARPAGPRGGQWNAVVARIQRDMPTTATPVDKPRELPAVEESLTTAAR